MNVITIIIHIKLHCYKYLDLNTSLFYDFLDNVCCSIDKYLGFQCGSHMN